jgi:thiol-disulfide isomerase/thioredoxin
MVGYIQRLGTALLAPHKAARALARGEPGGLRDVLWLLPLRILTGESALFLSDDLRAVVMGVLSALSIDILGIFLGGVVMALVLGRRERHLRPGLTTDLTAQGWLGWLFVQAAAALIFVVAQHQPGPGLQQAVQVAGLVVWLGYWAVGLVIARQLAGRAGAESGGAPTGPTEPDSAVSLAALGGGQAARWAGGLLVCTLLTLAVYDLVWLNRQHGSRPKAGRAAPDFTVHLVAVAGGAEGKTGEFRLSAESGHPVLIDFWATWCGPCRESLPIVDQVYQRLQPRGLRAIAVDTGEDERLVSAFAARLGLKLPVGLDTGEVAAQFGVSSIPHLVLVGSDGGIKRVFRGVHSAAELEQAVLSLGF